MKTKHTQKQRLFSLLWIGVLLTGLAAILYSCYPGDPISASDTDVVTTFYSPNADFGSKTTYAMPEFVIYFDDSGIDTAGIGLNNTQILTTIKTNMTNFGFALEDDSSQADVHIVALATKTKWVGGSCYPSYWGGWYGYPGWCYPVAYSYETGTLLIVMLDPDTSQNSDAQPIWLAGINGLLSGSTPNPSRINSAINQAFEQSSDYLKK
jgi:hypothetical protein